MNLFQLDRKLVCTGTISVSSWKCLLHTDTRCPGERRTFAAGSYVYINGFFLGGGGVVAALNRLCLSSCTKLSTFTPSNRKAKKPPGSWSVVVALECVFSERQATGVVRKLREMVEGEMVFSPAGPS